MINSLIIGVKCKVRKKDNVRLIFQVKSECFARKFPFKLPTCCETLPANFARCKRCLFSKAFRWRLSGLLLRHATWRFSPKFR